MSDEKSNSKIILNVAAKAVIPDAHGRVLVVREGKTYNDSTQTGLYGIPGGRVELGESYMDGLIREAYEETGLKVSFESPLHIREWSPDINGVKHQIIAIYSVCNPQDTEVTLSDEHDDFKWVRESDIKTTPIMPLDIEVLHKYFRNRIR